MTGWTVMLIAMGGFMLIEGALWAIFPGRMRQALQAVFSQEERVLHLSGLFSVAIGVVFIAWGVNLLN